MVILYVPSNMFHNPHSMQCLLSVIYESNPENCGDIFLDVAEAFMDVGKFELASLSQLDVVQCLHDTC